MTEHDKLIMKQKTLNSRKSFPLQHGGSFWNSTGVNAEEEDEDRELSGLPFFFILLLKKEYFSIKFGWY